MDTSVLSDFILLAFHYSVEVFNLILPGFWGNFWLSLYMFPFFVNQTSRITSNLFYYAQCLISFLRHFLKILPSCLL